MGWSIGVIKFSLLKISFCSKFAEDSNTAKYSPNGGVDMNCDVSQNMGGGCWLWRKFPDAANFPSLIRFLRRTLTLLRFLPKIECGESPETRLRGLNTHHGPVTAHHSPSLLPYAPSTTLVPMRFILSLTALAALVGVASAAGAPIPCTLDKDCSLGAMCAQNTCIVNYCKAHTDCAAGYFCLNGMCSIGAPGGNCYSCSRDEYCNVQSFCLGWDHVCRVDADCAKGWYCNAGGICRTQSTPSTDL